MSNKVKVKVSGSHFRNSFNTGKTKLRENEEKKVEVTPAVRNAVQSGTLELIEGSLGPDKKEKSFQGNEQDRKESEEADESEKELEDFTKDELKDMCEEKGLKKSGKKQELVERLKNQ